METDWSKLFTESYHSKDVIKHVHKMFGDNDTITLTKDEFELLIVKLSTHIAKALEESYVGK